MESNERLRAAARVGGLWAEGFDLLGESIALVHVKDQVGPQSVPFGTGEVDLPGLFAHMKAERATAVGDGPN